MNDEDNERIGCTFIFNNAISHMVIWYHLDDDSSNCEIWSNEILTDGLTANYIITNEDLGYFEDHIDIDERHGNFKLCMYIEYG